MFFNALYCFGYLPKSIQLIVLIIFSVITIRTLTHMNGYEADPCILITVFYFIRRLIEWLFSFRIHDWSIIILIVSILAILVFIVRKIKFMGILLWLVFARLIFIWNDQLSMFYGAILTVVSLLFMKSLLNLSKEKVLVYIILGFIIGFIEGSVIGIEALILTELLTRCIAQQGINGLLRFICLLICIFTSAYFIELAFAHSSVLLFLIVLILLLKKAIG